MLRLSAVKRRLKKLPAYLPFVLWVAFFTAAVGWIVCASLSTTREIFTNTIFTSGIHWENYVNAWQKNNIVRYFLNSLIVSSVSCLGILLIGAPAGYVLGHKLFKGRKLLTNTFLFAISVPSVMVIIPLFSVLIRANMVGRLETLILLYVTSNVPYTVYFLAGFFSTVPGALEEAALVDGCTNSRAFWTIMLPIASPSIITVTIFNFINTWNEYFIALIFVNSSSNNRTLAVGLQNMIFAMKFSGDWAGLFASVIIVFLPTLVIYLFLSEKIVAGITQGAIKG